MDNERVIQRLERMKMAANKFMDKLKATPDHPKAKRWIERLRELAQGIEIADLEAQAVILKQKSGGVEIAVPTKRFGLAANKPEIADAS